VLSRVAVTIGQPSRPPILDRVEPGDLRRLADHIVGPAEIADLLGVHANTINAWKVRDLGFPTPIRRLRGIDLWDRREVLAWAERTGRYPRSEPGDGGTTRRDSSSAPS
jgi:hypothetical protein